MRRGGSPNTADRLIEIIDPLNQSTRVSYDNRDNLLSVTDPNNHTTRYTYDRADRKMSEIHPGGQTITYTYDAAGSTYTVPVIVTYLPRQPAASHPHTHPGPGAESLAGLSIPL